MKGFRVLKLQVSFSYNDNRTSRRLSIPGIITVSCPCDLIFPWPR